LKQQLYSQYYTPIACQYAVFDVVFPVRILAVVVVTAINNGIYVDPPYAASIFNEYVKEYKLEYAAGNMMLPTDVFVETDPHCINNPLGNLEYPFELSNGDPRLNVFVDTVIVLVTVNDVLTRTDEVFTVKRFADVFARI